MAESDDTVNIEGVRLTYPLFPDHCYVFPANAAHRIRIGSDKEQTFRLISGLICAGLLTLNLAGERTLFRNLLGTPDAVARDYAAQLRAGYRTVAHISGIWTNGQDPLSADFDVIAATDGVIFVRQPADLRKIYQIPMLLSCQIGAYNIVDSRCCNASKTETNSTGIGGQFSAIAHARLKIVRRLRDAWVGAEGEDFDLVREGERE